MCGFGGLALFSCVAGGPMTGTYRVYVDESGNRAYNRRTDSHFGGGRHWTRTSDLLHVKLPSLCIVA